jgi:hypothetical protein
MWYRNSTDEQLQAAAWEYIILGNLPQPHGGLGAGLLGVPVGDQR